MCNKGCVGRCSSAFEKDYWSADNIHNTVDPIIISLSSDKEEEDLILDGIEV